MTAAQRPATCGPTSPTPAPSCAAGGHRRRCQADASVLKERMFQSSGAAVVGLGGLCGAEGEPSYACVSQQPGPAECSCITAIAGRLWHALVGSCSGARLARCCRVGCCGWHAARGRPGSSCGGASPAAVLHAPFAQVSSRVPSSSTATAYSHVVLRGHHPHSAQGATVGHSTFNAACVETATN